MTEKKAKCTGCKFFESRKNARNLKEQYICNAVINVVIPGNTIDVECNCQYYKRI